MTNYVICNNALTWSIKINLIMASDSEPAIDVCLIEETADDSEKRYCSKFDRECPTYIKIRICFALESAECKYFILIILFIAFSFYTFSCEISHYK